MNPASADPVNHQPALAAAQTYYLNHYPSPYQNPSPVANPSPVPNSNTLSNPNPNPNPNPIPYSAVATPAEIYENAAYYAQQPMYNSYTPVDATSAAAGYYQDPNAYNWQITFNAGVATNEMEQYVAAQVNPIAPETASKKKRKRQKVPVKRVQCEACKIECTSEEALVLHRRGKNHKKNIEKLKATLAVAPAVPSELINKPLFGSQVQQIFSCELCKIACNSKEHIESHVNGKKHLKNLEKMKASSVRNTVIGQQENAVSSPQEYATVDPQENAPNENAPLGKAMMGQQENAIISSQETAIISPQENAIICPQENAMMGKQENAIVDPQENALQENAMMGQKEYAIISPEENAIISPQENAIISPRENAIIGPQENARKRKVEANESEDSQTKKKRVVKNARKVCAICDVECNSDLTFESHLAGHKHLSMLKKHLAVETDDMKPKEEKVVEKPPLLETEKTENVEEQPKLLETKKKTAVDSVTVVDSVKYCEYCGVVCNSDLVYRYHLLGKKHKAMVKKGKGIQDTVTCEICKVECTSDLVLESHLAGQKHLAMVKKKSAKEDDEDLDTETEKLVDGVKICKLCNIICNSDLAYKAHLSGKKHVAMVKKGKDETQVAAEC